MSRDGSRLPCAIDSMVKPTVRARLPYEVSETTGPPGATARRAEVAFLSAS